MSYPSNLYEYGVPKGRGIHRVVPVGKVIRDGHKSLLVVPIIFKISGPDRGPDRNSIFDFQNIFLLWV